MREFIPFLPISLMLIVIWLINRVIVIKKNVKNNTLREIIINIFFIYFLAVIYFTFFKNGMMGLSFEREKAFNIVPMKETVKMFLDNHTGIHFALYNIVGNILLFVPFGFGIPLLFNKCNKFAKVLLYGCLSSLLVEILQFFTATNTSDIDDIIFNTTGAAIGLICFRLIYKISEYINLDKFIKKFSDDNKQSFIKIAIKPGVLMLLCSILFSFSILYSKTYSDKLSDQELAVKAFSAYGGGKYVATKQFDKYKFYLVNNGSYLELDKLDKVLGNRYISDSSYQCQLGNNICGYGIEFIEDYNHNTLSLVIFGRNNSSKNITISFNGKEFKEELKPNGFFICAYPQYEVLTKNSDIYNVYNGKASKALKISFSNEDGSENSGMNFIK